MCFGVPPTSPPPQRTCKLSTHLTENRINQGFEASIHLQIPVSDTSNSSDVATPPNPPAKRLSGACVWDSQGFPTHVRTRPCWCAGGQSVEHTLSICRTAAKRAASLTTDKLCQKLFLHTMLSEVATVLSPNTLKSSNCNCYCFCI